LFSGLGTLKWEIDTERMEVKEIGSKSLGVKSEHEGVRVGKEEEAKVNVKIGLDQVSEAI